jgi:SWI/SNF-related matrix-associated actin-dependent regulator of chromatin subfamily A3
MIKEHSTIQSRAACELSAQRRTCLSGTPLQNSLNDLYSLLKFLQVEPFTDRAIWTHYIGGPAKTGDQLAVSRLQLLVRHIALRRSKETKNADGQPILALPPKKDEIVYLELNEQERAFYTSHHRRYKSQFLVHEQNDTLLQNYASILQELLRLRQICVHYALVRDSEDASFQGQGGDDDPVELIIKHGVSKSRALSFFSFLRDSGSAQCAECGYEMSCEEGLETPTEDEPKKKSAKSKGDSGAEPICVITKCTHVYCICCFKQISPGYPQNATATDRAACGICKTDITPVLDAILLTKGDLQSEASGDASGLMTKADDSKRKTRSVEHSTKIRELMADLTPFSQANPATANYIEGFGEDSELVDRPLEEIVDIPQKGQAIKSVVFSQVV